MPQIPGRELLGEVATRRLWSVCKGLGAVLLEATEEAGLADTPASEALGLDIKTGAPLHKGWRAAGPSSTGRGRNGAQQGFSNGHEARDFGFFIPLLNRPLVLLEVMPKVKTSGLEARATGCFANFR